MKKAIYKKIIYLIIFMSLITNGYAAIVSDNDGSAFVTNILCVKKIRIPIAHRLR